MTLIYLSKGFSTLVDEEDFDELSKYKWCINGNGYVTRNIVKEGKNTMVLMHRHLLTPEDGQDVDHINRCKTDNRRSNLRVCTRSQNRCNTGASPKSRTGLKGVSYDSKNKKFAAYICLNRKRKNLGRFSTAQEAHDVYAAAAKTLHGEYFSPR